MANYLQREHAKFKDVDLPEHGSTVTVEYRSERSRNEDGTAKILSKTGWSANPNEDFRTFTLDVDSKGEQILHVEVWDDYGRVSSEGELRDTYLGQLESVEVEETPDEREARKAEEAAE